jgi:hypothetical protein
MGTAAYGPVVRVPRRPRGVRPEGNHMPRGRHPWRRRYPLFVMSNTPAGPPGRTHRSAAEAHHSRGDHAQHRKKWLTPRSAGVPVRVCERAPMPVTSSTPHVVQFGSLILRIALALQHMHPPNDGLLQVAIAQRWRRAAPARSARAMRNSLRRRHILRRLGQEQIAAGGRAEAV